MSAISTSLSSSTYNWKLFLLLWISAVVAGIMVLPYALKTQSASLSQVGTSGMSTTTLILLQIVQQAVLSAIAIGIGLLLADKIGLRLPYLTAITRGEALLDGFPRVLALSILAGIAAGVFVWLADVFWLAPAMNSWLSGLGISIPESIRPNAWQGFLASFYGGITEEIQMRLFLFTLFAWLGHFVSKSADGQPSLGVMWAAMILAAVVFGIGHLPATSAMGIPLGGIVIVRVIILNMVPGILFGWLYWRFGLTSAILAHFTADILIHVIAPIFIKP